MKITLRLSQTVIKPFLSTNSSHPALGGALIKDGHIYATDGCVCLKQPVVEEKTPWLGLVLPLTAFPKGKNGHTKVASEDDKTLEVVEYNSKRVEIERRTVQAIDYQYPDIYRIWPTKESAPLNNVRLSIHLLSKFKPLLDKNDGVTFEFYEPENGFEQPIIIKHEEWTGLIMPMKQPR